MTRLAFDFFDLFGAVFNRDWADDAYCGGNTREEIFLEEEHLEVAKRFCDRCPVRRQCLDDALYYGDGGTRAGFTEKERESIIMHRRRNSKAFQYDLGLIDA